MRVLFKELFIAPVVALLSALPLCGQTSLHTLDEHGVAVSTTVYFHMGEARIDMDYRGNAAELSHFIFLLDSLYARGLVVDNKLAIVSSASPEGTSRSNLALCDKRSDTILDYLRLKLPCYGDLQISARSIGDDWDALGSCLRSNEINWRERAIYILENTPYYVFEDKKIVGGKKKSLMDYKAGRLWWEMDEKLFPQLRKSVITFYVSPDLPSVDAMESLDTMEVVPPTGADTVEPAQPALADTLAVASRPVADTVEVEQSPVIDTAPISDTPVEAPAAKLSRRPIAAIRTNLLMDAATILNAGVEFPIGQRFSIEADAYFPWWEIPSRDITIQLLGATVEGKYWFGDRSLKAPMTGFFGGLYAGAGYYDFQFGKGVQGELFIMGGLSAGYSHEIARNLRLEYSLGLGYVRSDFREYVPAKDTKYGDIKVRPYPWDEKRFSGFIPTKAAISLVWTFGGKKEVRDE